MRRLKNALAWTIVVIIIRILIAPPHTGHSFNQAVVAFSFRTLDPNNACILLATISILVPIVLLTILLYDIYRAHYTFGEMIRTIISSHVFYGYVTLSSIYILDLIRDRYFVPSHTDSNEWNKYILHFVLAPPLFVDSVYSVEVERIRTRSKKYNPKDLTFNVYTHYIAQAMFGMYLLYALLVILFINNDFDFSLADVIKYKDPAKAAIIFGHIKTLVKEIIWCVFASLSMGLTDQWILFRSNAVAEEDGG